MQPHQVSCFEHQDGDALPCTACPTPMCGSDNSEEDIIDYIPQEKGLLKCRTIRASVLSQK
jgi:hypothetical protein